MPIGGVASQNQTSFTPGRKTHVRFDIPDPVVLESPQAFQRGGDDICRAGLGATGPGGKSSGIHKLGTGGYCLEYAQLRRQGIHERGDPTSAVIRKSGWNIIAAYGEVPLWRKLTEIAGAGYDAAVAASGDHFLVKRIPAGADLSGAAYRLGADQTAHPSPTLPTANAPMDRIGVTSGNPFPINQGFVVRFRVPATALHSPDFIMTVLFGGPIEPNGNGEYAISFSGSGKAILNKRVVVSSAWTWVPVDEFVYADPHKICDGVHEVQIIPQFPPNRRVIEFRSSITDLAPQSDLTRRYIPAASMPRTHLFELWPRNTIAPGGSVTGEGPLRVDVRRDIKVKKQFSLVTFLTAGTLIDLPFVIPLATPRSNLVLFWTATIPAGCTIDGKLYDATTKVELTVQAGSGVPNTKTYKPNYGQSSYYATFTLTGSGASTPILWSYAVTKDGIIATATPGEFDAIYVQNVSVTGPDQDPSHETASCTVQDLTDTLTRLKVRGRFNAQIETEYDPNDSTLRSVVSRGYAISPKARRAGKIKHEGISGAGVTRVFPAAGWRQFETNFIAYWNRLKERPPMILRFFSDDGTGQPFKVTDVIRAAFGWAGFPSTMIDVPDLPQRLWPSLGGDDVSMVDPLTDLLDMIAKLARNYLYMVIVFDGNVGVGGNVKGMWRLRPPVYAPYTNLAQFTTTGVSGKKSVLRCETYNTGVSNYVGTNLKVPIFAGEDGISTLETYTNPPEANFVLVTGTSDLTPNNGGKLGLPNWFANPKSFDFYCDAGGNVIHTADPDHPDYIGTMVPIIIIDTALNSPQAVSFAVRRQAWISCMATKMGRFEAPYVLVTDPKDTTSFDPTAGIRALTKRPRALRYYDPVLIDGAQFLIRCCNPGWSKDGMQKASYEAMAPRDGGSI